MHASEIDVRFELSVENAVTLRGLVIGKPNDRARQIGGVRKAGIIWNRRGDPATGIVQVKIAEAYVLPAWGSHPMGVTDDQMVDLQLEPAGYFNARLDTASVDRSA